MKSTLPIHVIDRLYELLKGVPLVILESQLENHPSAIRSFVAAKPRSSITAVGSKIEIAENGEKRVQEMNPWEALKKFRSGKKRWLFGFFGYDLKNFNEDLSSSNPHLAELPDFYFMEPEILLEIEEGRVTVLEGDLNSEVKKPIILPGSIENELVPLIGKEEYVAIIEHIQDMIRNGDFYEMNYTYPLCGSHAGDPYWLYMQMREINPVPFGAFISTDRYSVCCASPERFLKKSGLTVRSEPIKGTSGRSYDSETDRASREELLNEKNRAENLMIVDLVRHDLSKVSKPGSVRVSNLYNIQSFGTVHQLISTVESTAHEDVDPVDIIRNCFPMGSMSGAPKIEVMKTIEELEIYKRGIYSGAIGYFSPDEDFDFNVVIRTAILQGDSLFYPVGGAITSDSDPELEWMESQIKSRNITEIFTGQMNLSK